nr:uncharacterized protein LOC117684419 [Crassostrea gigas]
MVLPTVLKRRHTLKGVKLMPVLKNIRGGQPEALKDFARIELPDIEKHVRELSGEELEDIVQMDVRELNVQEARWVVHSLILFANEVGQNHGAGFTRFSFYQLSRTCQGEFEKKKIHRRGARETEREKVKVVGEILKRSS